MDERAKHELVVFSEFAQSWSAHSELAYESRTPPEPDIFCGSGPFGSCFFELGRLLDPESPKLHLEARRVAPAGVKADFSKFGWPERDVLLAKLTKRYGSGVLPVYLLLYWDWDSSNHLTANEPPPWNTPFCVVGGDLLTPAVVATQHVFAGIFYFHRRARRTLWLWRRSG